MLSNLRKGISAKRGLKNLFGVSRWGHGYQGTTHLGCRSKLWFDNDPEPCGFVSPEFQPDPSHGDPFQAKFFKILNPD